jgi:hypothetical protein
MSVLDRPFRKPNARSAQIALLNDRARQTMGIGCLAVMTAGIAALSEADQSAIREAVERFSDFTYDNDPHGEHDFGAFTHNGERIFWKIDYYDRELENGSEDEADPAVTTRVLTIMLAEDY